MWKAIKSRFSGNDESKKMQKYLLKPQFEGFFVSTSERLHKGYDRFQILLSQLDIHGAGVSHEDTNQKFLSALQIDYDDLEQINDDDMEEIDLKWQTAELKGTNTSEEEMLGTIETKLETMVEDLHIKMTQKLWLPLMERILSGLDMLRKMLRTML
nr:ribonuclease H-like domain-containing protein [Tanacetum cinerariifolium]